MGGSDLDRNLEEDAGGVTLVRWDPVRPRPTEPGVLRPVSNFGDLLGPVIVRRLLQLAGDAVGTGTGRLLSVGSVLHFARPGDTVWGSGVNGKIPMADLLDAGRLDVRATRGPFSAAVLARNGHTVPAVHGDPALLLPELFPETLEWSAHKRRGTTIVPNLHDHAVFAADERSVDPQSDLWSIVRAIAESELVVGSSLHGIIVAEALGIPARAIRSSAESVFKYEDYYAGTGRWSIDLAADVVDAERRGGVTPPLWDSVALRGAFPADLWGVAATTRVGADPWDGRETADRIEERLRAEAYRMTRRDIVTLATTADAARGADGRAPVDVTSLRRQASSNGGETVPTGATTVVVIADRPDEGLAGTVRSVLEAVDSGIVVVITTGDPRTSLAATELLGPRVRRIEAPGVSFGEAVDIGVDAADDGVFAVLRSDSRAAGLGVLLSSPDGEAPLAVGRVLQFSSTETWDASRAWHDGRSRTVRRGDWPESITVRSLDGLAMTTALWRRVSEVAGGNLEAGAAVRACLDAAPAIRFVGVPAVLRRTATLDPPPGRHRPERLALERRLREEIPFAEAASVGDGRTRAAYVRSFLSDRGRERLALGLYDAWSDNLAALDVSLCGAAAHLVSVVPDGSLDSLPDDLRRGLLALSRGDTDGARQAVCSE